MFADSGQDERNKNANSRTHRVVDADILTVCGVTQTTSFRLSPGNFAARTRNSAPGIPESRGGREFVVPNICIFRRECAPPVSAARKHLSREKTSFPRGKNIFRGVEKIVLRENCLVCVCLRKKKHLYARVVHESETTKHLCERKCFIAFMINTKKCVVMCTSAIKMIHNTNVQPQIHNISLMYGQEWGLTSKD